MLQGEDSMVFDLDRPFDAEAFKKVLQDSGYSQIALAETLGITSAHEHQDPEIVCRRVRTEGPYSTLVHLFWLGHRVVELDVRRSLPALDVDTLEAVGVLRRSDGMLESNVMLAPFFDLLLVSDFGPDIKQTITPDHVLGVGAASVTLANLTVRQKGTTALDLGCGAGIQAFLAARHVDRIIGTDTSPRALDFAELNARINGINSVQWRLGNLYEPVENERFDLIVANPPFVISPESRFVFRDSPMPGDAISEQVIRGTGARLNEGGFACVLFNWHHKDVDDWQIRPQDWVSDAGCDALMMCFKSTDPLVYAADWLRSTLGKDSPDYGRSLDEWMAYYQEMDAGRISAGAIIIRKRSAQTNWFRAHAIGTGSYTGSCGSQIERLFAAEDLLESLDDRGLLEQRLTFDENHLLRHELSVEEGRWAIRTSRLYASEGLPFAGNLDLYIGNLLSGCNGQRTLRELIVEVAEGMKTDPEKIMPGCLGVIRKLMQSGFLS
jgi:methylase of polypeptide subunit release factors